MIVACLVIYLLVLIGIGLIGSYYTQKSHEAGNTSWANEFFTGGKAFGPIVIGLTFAATYASGGTFVGHPGLGYANGLTWSWAYLMSIWCAFIPFLWIGKRMYRVGHKISALSLQDVIEYRYENNKFLAITLVLLTAFFYMAYIVSQLAAAARVMSITMDMSYEVGLTIFAVVLIFYVSISGMRGVAWADTVQGFIMVTFVLSIIPMMALHAGGVGAMTSVIQDTKPELLRGGFDGTATAIGAMISFMFVTHAWQAAGQPASAQRLIIFSDIKTYRVSMLIAGFLMAFMSGFMVLAGTLGNAIFPGLEVADTIIPRLVMTIYPPALAGIAVAAILAGVNTSANGYMLVVSTNITKDLLIDYVKTDMTEPQVHRWSKIITALVGVVGLILAYNPPDFIGLLVLYAWRGLGLGVGIPLVFGCLWKGANKWGALSSVFVSLSVYLYIHATYGIHFLGLGMDPSTWGLVTGMITMVVVSLATKRTNQKVLDVFFDEDAVDRKREAKKARQMASSASVTSA